MKKVIWVVLAVLAVDNSNSVASDGREPQTRCRPRSNQRTER
jgi:hypothetical protein